MPRNRMGGCGLHSFGLVMNSCEHGNEPSGSIKDGEFFDYLCDYQLLKKDSAP
jgi:hypothetical protein